LIPKRLFYVTHSLGYREFQLSEAILDAILKMVLF